MTPFEKYPNEGRNLLGEPPAGDGTTRHGYGPPVFEHCGMVCVYCSRNLKDSYEDWLDIQIDHVVPCNAIRRGFPEEWIKDIANCVTCCAACNAFLNRFTVEDGPPQQLQEFFDLRDRTFEKKKKHAQKRHEEEYGYWLRKVRNDS